MSVFLITGSSRGLGRALVTAAAEAGHQVVATARDAAQLGSLVKAHPESVAEATLDVTEPAGAAAAVETALARFGRVDVVINNAGYANVAPIESAQDDDFRAQFETNFWGVYNVSKAVIGQMRLQQSGTIVQISSVGGRVGGSPGIASYQAAKFAVDGFSRVLAVETAPFGIRVLVVEPSGFATDWAGPSMTVHEIPAGYEPTVGFMHERMRASADGPAGDPERAAEIIVAVSQREHVPTHLPLGVNAVEMSQDYSRAQLAEAGAWEAVGRSADFGQTYPSPFPADASSE